MRGSCTFVPSVQGSRWKSNLKIKNVRKYPCVGLYALQILHWNRTFNPEPPGSERIRTLQPGSEYWSGSVTPPYLTCTHPVNARTKQTGSLTKHFVPLRPDLLSSSSLKKMNRTLSAFLTLQYNQSSCRKLSHSEPEPEPEPGCFALMSTSHRVSLLLSQRFSSFRWCCEF